MTAPVPHGYADFQVQAAQLDIVFIRDSRTINAAFSYPAFFVGTSEAINVNFSGVVGRFRVSIEYFDDPVALHPLGQQEFMTGLGGGFSGNINNIGPWVIIVVSPGAAGNQYSISVSSGSKGGMHLGAAALNVLVSGTGLAVGIGAAVVVESQQTMPGWAYWSMHQSAGTCQMSLHYTDEHGTVIALDRKILIAGADVGELVFLPAAPVGVQCFNTSGAATNFDAYLIARPDMTGG